MLINTLRNRLSPRRFRRDAGGATAVEFGLVAFPFFGMLAAMVETGLVFFSGQALDSAAYNAGRRIMTGEVKSAGDAAAQKTKFATLVCDEIGWLLDCNKVYYDVQSYGSFGAANLNAPVTNGDFDTTGLPRYTASGSGQIVVVRAYYKKAIYADYLGGSLGYLTGGYHLLVGTSVFKNEPF